MSPFDGYRDWANVAETGEYEPAEWITDLLETVHEGRVDSRRPPPSGHANEVERITFEACSPMRCASERHLALMQLADSYRREHSGGRDTGDERRWALARLGEWSA